MSLQLEISGEQLQIPGSSQPPSLIRGSGLGDGAGVGMGAALGVGYIVKFCKKADSLNLKR